jgi:hypothetical protein
MITRLHRDSGEYPGRAGSCPESKFGWFAIHPAIMQADAAERAPTAATTRWKSMATDYDAPRKTDDDTESIQALQERTPDKLSGVVDVDDASADGFELGGADLSDLDLDVVVLPPQADEFTCVNCFLVKLQSQFDHDTKLGPICVECAA